MEVVPSTALSYAGSALAYVDDEHFAYIMVIRRCRCCTAATATAAATAATTAATTTTSTAAATMATITMDQVHVPPTHCLLTHCKSNRRCLLLMHPTNPLHQQHTTGQRAPIRGRHHWQDQDLPLGRPPRHLGVRLLVQGAVGGGSGQVAPASDQVFRVAGEWMGESRAAPTPMAPTAAMTTTTTTPAP